MDRQIVYPGAIPLETDLLNTNKYNMIGLSKLAAALLGTSTFLNGLACTPNSPADLTVKIAPGEIYSLQNIDGTAYSSLAADTTHTILKQGISLDQLTLSCPAPVTVGQSINYLIQATYQDVDSGATVLPYYNASNPSLAYSGPNNSGTAQNTVRKGVCTVSAKAGVAATTGSQTTPAPDAGYVGALVVTVAYGQTQITAPNITAYAGAPIIPSGGLIVGGLQGNACNISAAGGTADAITGSYTPGITALTNGMTLYIRAGSANTTTTPTFTPNSGTIAAKTIVKGAGAALAAGDIAGGGHWIEVQYDATLDKWVLLNPAKGISSSSATIQGAFKNLKVSAPGNSANITVTADELVVEASAGDYETLRSLALTINSAASGANGLDTGTLAASTWYSVWAISDGTNKAGLLSLSATSPTMPGSYTRKARVGWIRTDASGNKYPLGFTQAGRYVTPLIGSGNVTTPQQMASGASGTYSTSTFTGVAVAWANYAPPTAAKIRVGMSGNTTGILIGVASNANRTGFATANPPELGFDSSAYPLVTYGDLLLESSNIYWACSGGTGYLLAGGWEDNL